MSNFKDFYRRLYRTFGSPLNARTATHSDVLKAAEKRLGVRVPAAVRDYYLVAGNERRFNKSLNRILRPQDWFVDKGRLIFMEENQSVVWWGVSVRNGQSADPPISQGINDDPVSWFPEHRKCSVFLAVMLHYQAVSGGLRYCGRAVAPEQSGYRFEKHGWTDYGEVNSLRAFSRPNQVICLMPPGDLPFMQNWTVLAGAQSKNAFKSMSSEIGLEFE